MAINLGNVVGLIKSTTPPTKKYVLWGKILNPSFPDIVEINYWDEIVLAWTPVTDPTTNYWLRPVINRTTTNPPGSPVEGDRYLVASGGTGAWAGKDDQVATWRNGAWVFQIPLDGFIVSDRSEVNTLLDYRGTYGAGGSWFVNDFQVPVNPADFIPVTQKDAPQGVAPLDDNRKVPALNIDGTSLPYIPGAPGDWAFVPATIWQALDYLVANPYTPPPSGDVFGPGASEDNGVVVFNATTGKIIKASGGYVDASGNLVMGVAASTAGATRSITVAGTATDINLEVVLKGTSPALVVKTLSKSVSIGVDQFTATIAPGGAYLFRTSDATSTDRAGSLHFKTGHSMDGRAGDIRFTPGVASGIGKKGNLQFFGDATEYTTWGDLENGAWWGPGTETADNPVAGGYMWIDASNDYRPRWKTPTGVVYHMTMVGDVTDAWSRSTGAVLLNNNTISGAYQIDFQNTSIRFRNNQLQINNPANTFYYVLASSAISANRTLTLPQVAGNRYIATLVSSIASGRVPISTATVGDLTSDASFTYSSGTLTASKLVVGGLTITPGSVLVDFQSTALGVLMPRVTTIASVVTPVAGMVAYDLATNSFNFRESTNWFTLLKGSTGAVDNSILRADGTGGQTLQSSPILITDNADLDLGIDTVTGGAVRTFQAKGSATNISINMYAKGSGGFFFTGSTIALEGIAAVSLTSPYSQVTNTVSSTGGELRIMEGLLNGSNYIALKSPNSVLTTVTYTLPEAPSVNGQVLSSDTSGVLSWVSPVGDVVGPAGATANGIPRYNLTTGKLIKDSRASINDDGDILIGTGAAGGGRQISSDGTLPDVSIFLVSKGTGSASLSTGSGKSLRISGAANIATFIGGDFKIESTLSLHSYNLTLATADANPTGDYNSGHLFITSGAKGGIGLRGNIAFGAPSVSTWASMQAGIFIANCSAIPLGNPTGGGFLYVEAGALKWWGSSGTITTLGPA